MKKFIISAVLIFSMLIFSACSIGGSRTNMLNKDNDEEKANAQLEEIIESIKNKDKDNLKSLFSQKALSEVDDFDSSMNVLFDFLKVKLNHGKNQAVQLCLNRMIMVI